jgi:aminoglycoside phosphotransferase (APT) family kinase protein
MIAHAFPQEVIAHVEPFEGGLINTNLKVYFDSGHHPVVLRVYRDGPDVARKEAATHNLVQAAVPVARVIDAVLEGIDGSNAFAILEFVDGITFQQLMRTGDTKAIEDAARSVGETLAAIGRFQFSSAGRLIVDREQLCVGDPYIEGPSPIPELLDRILESATCQQRLGTELLNRLHDFGWSWADRLPDLDQNPTLVHSDYGNRNILVNQVNGHWRVVAVLDWEFSFSGSSLLDVGHFLRYERKQSPIREPHFSQSFVEHGGRLPENWWEIVRVIDLTALVQCLTIDDLPIDVEEELLGLIRQTLTDLG